MGDESAEYIREGVNDATELLCMTKSFWVFIFVEGD